MLIGLVVDAVLTCCQENNGTGLLRGSSRQTVVVDPSNGRILSISSTIPQDNNLKLYHFPPGSTLLPGFIDCHVHLTIGTDDYQIDHLRLTSADKTLRALKAAQGLLHAGFTTLRSAGDADSFYPSFAVARSFRNKDFLGPRIVGAGHYISVTGGGGDICFLACDNCPCVPSDGIVANGKYEMIAACRKEMKYGADWIKILATGAFMSSTGPKDSPENTHFSSEELVACVEEASRRKVHVMAHAHGAHGIALASNSGCRSIEHASFINEEGIEACLRNGTYIVPTFSIGQYFDEVGSDTGAQDRLIALQKATNQRYFSCIQAAVRAGVKVALGSDFVGWDPKITAREFRYLVELAEMTPLDAIQAGTLRAAEMLEIEDIGRIAPGCQADIVVVLGDPLKDISVLETGVVFVMKGGEVARDDLDLGKSKI